MNGWLTQLFGEQGATWTLYILGGAAILVLAWVAWFWNRRVAGGVFVEGGRNRKHRLAVVDATAVDSSRRIVLVRRDDIEHLVMIGGQNDFVIESNIESTPAETAQRGQPRDRRGREAQAASQGRRPPRQSLLPATRPRVPPLRPLPLRRNRPAAKRPRLRHIPQQRRSRLLQSRRRPPFCAVFLNRRPPCRSPSAHPLQCSRRLSPCARQRLNARNRPSTPREAPSRRNGQSLSLSAMSRWFRHRNRRNPRLSRNRSTCVKKCPCRSRYKSPGRRNPENR